MLALLAGVALMALTQASGVGYQIDPATGELRLAGPGGAVMGLNRRSANPWDAGRGMVGEQYYVNSPSDLAEFNALKASDPYQDWDKKYNDIFKTGGGNASAAENAVLAKIMDLGPSVAGDAGWDQAAKLGFIKSSPTLGGMLSTLVNNNFPNITPGQGYQMMPDGWQRWDPQYWNLGQTEPRWLYGILNESTSQSDAQRRLNEWEQYRAKQDEPSWFDKFGPPVIGGILTGGAAAGLGAGAGSLAGAGDAFGSMAAYDAGTSALGGAGAGAGAASATPSLMDQITQFFTPSPTSVASSGVDQLAQAGGSTATDVTAPTIGSTGIQDFGDQYPIPPDVAKPPAPAVSIPGVGDVYGSRESIIKSIKDLLPAAGGASTLIKNLNGGGSSSSGGGTTINIGQGKTDGELLGGGLAALLGFLGSQDQAKTLRDLAEKARAERAPFLNASTGWLNDPASFAAGPGKAAMDSTLRALSVNGNPIGEGTSLALANDSALRNWQNAVTGFGNMGLAGQDTRAQLGTAAAGADAGALNAVGAGINDFLTPRRATLADQLARIYGLT